MSKPLAVLKSVEDSPPALDRRLVEAYLRTVYRVLDPAFELRIGTFHPGLEQWLARSGFETYAFITAWNPASEMLPQPVNQARQAALLAALSAVLPGGVYPALHSSETSGWPDEASWWAPGLAPETAVSLARRFGQNALVFGRSGLAAELWWIAEP